MADAALSAAQWVVGKALAPVAGTVLEAWAHSRNFGLNIEALRDELLQVEATLEQAPFKELVGSATEKLLQNLQDSAHNAEDLLDELDYFRIHDKLHDTYNAANEHGRSGFHDLALNARHTAKAVGKQLASLPAYWCGSSAGDPQQEDARQHVKCCAWQRGTQRSRRDYSLGPNGNQANQEVKGCMPNLGKLLPSTSSPHPHVHADEDHGNVQETTKPEFNRVDLSQRMKDVIGQLKLMHKKVYDMLQTCGPRTVPNIAQSHPTTTTQRAEPKLYGRDGVMSSIIHDITKGLYCDKGLTVLPVVGSGGIGKTTLMQHIYHNEQVKKHFPVMIWVCVSLNFNLAKVLQEIENQTPQGEGENKCSRIEERVEQRLKSSKRFLLVLDDIWQISNGDDWGKLLLTLGQSQEKGSIIIVTTRLTEIAHKLKTTEEPKELDRLEPQDFRKLFLASIFVDGKYPRDKPFLQKTGDKIMEKLKGSPLAAKTVGSLLSNDLSLIYWRRVLKSKQWMKETNGIMPALMLSYDFLPFHLQRCFSCSALFPEDYNFRSHELISLWIGLDILITYGQNQTFQEIGLSNLNALVVHGFFKEETDKDGQYYVMHDLLHDLALKVASHDFLSLCLPNVGLIEIQPSTRHLSIITRDLGEYDLKEELDKLKTTLKVEQLQTLMLFGEMDENFAKIFRDFIGEANGFRVLYLPFMLSPVESMLNNFSQLVHLRFLCLGTRKGQMHLPLNISNFYHLRVLDLKSWCGNCHLPKDMSNLAKLCHFHTQSYGELHSDICNVGELKLLEVLKVFRVNKRSEGFEPKQLSHLTMLRELGIYNLEKIHTVEAAQAMLVNKIYLRRLTLDWDSERSSVDPGEEAMVLESLHPPEDLQVLCIRGHKGPSYPTWLGDEFSVQALQSLYLYDVSWEVFPSLGEAWDLRELRLVDIGRPKEFIIEKSFCMIIKLELIGLGSFEKWVLPAEQEFSLGGDSSPPDADMFPRLQVLIIRRCPELLVLPFLNWIPKLQELEIWDCPKFSTVIPIPWIESLRRVNIQHVKLLKEFAYSKSSDGGELRIEGIRGKELTDLLPHLPRLSKLVLMKCESIKKLVVGVNLQQTKSATSEMEEDEITTPEEEVDDGVLLFPAHLFDSLQELVIHGCPELALVDPPTLVPGGGWLQPLQSLRRLQIMDSHHLLSAFLVSRHLFPSSLQSLVLTDAEGMGTLEPLSNLSSLVTLVLNGCGKDLKCQGLQSLLTTGGQLRELRVIKSPIFFVGWDLNTRRALENVEGGEVQQTQLVSSTLQELWTDDATGLLAASICSFLSSSLTELQLYGNSEEMEFFTKEQEDALQLLSSLKELGFRSFHNLQQLPAGLRNLASLEKLSILLCPAISSLPNDGLQDSLKVLDVNHCGNKELKEQCRGLVGTIPKIIID